MRRDNAAWLALGNEARRSEFTLPQSGLDMSEFAPPGNLRVAPAKARPKLEFRKARALLGRLSRPLPADAAAQRTTNRVTLITGASAGIGRELARVFAAKGHRLALVDRSGDGLELLAREIASAGGPAPILIACDLEHREAGETISARLAAAEVEVEFVVNNAGFGLFGHATELDRTEQLGIIAVNVRALTDLSLRFSDSLIKFAAVSSISAR